MSRPEGLAPAQLCAFIYSNRQQLRDVKERRLLETATALAQDASELIELG